MNLLAADYHSDIDYRRGSPHLAQLPLYDRLVEVLRGTVRRLAEQGLPLRVLEIGAGHGGFTEAALALGCDVTAVDVSESSVEELKRRFGTWRHDHTGKLGQRRQHLRRIRNDFLLRIVSIQRLHLRRQ